MSEEPDLIYCSNCKCNQTPDKFVKDETTYKTCNKCRDRGEKRRYIAEPDSDSDEEDEDMCLLYCSTCKCNKSPEHFVKDDTTFKTCNKCRNRVRSKPVADAESENCEQDDEFTGRNYNYKTRYNKYKSDDPDFNIPLDKFVEMIVSLCDYCGIRNLNKGFNGIDRVDSTLPHIIGNCVPACWDCNRRKGASPRKEFLMHIKRIYEYLHLENIENVK
jgi:hypothetical protein